MKGARQKLVLLCCFVLAACAGPFRLYDGDRLPSDETVVIEREDDYAILSFDGIGPVPDEEKSIEVLPGQHRLIAYHRYATECDGGARGSGNEIIGLAAIVVGAVGCYATSDRTHCAILDFHGEAGRSYAMTAGGGHSVVLTDRDSGAEIARAGRIYQGDMGDNEFLRFCSTRSPNPPARP